MMQAMRDIRVMAALLALAALGLGGCAETKLVGAGAKSATRPAGASASASPGKGVYKVGNPYQVAGVWYYPKENPRYDETGIASWYGPGFHGKYTANGEAYDMNDLTAAHQTLPMPVFVRVTNLENGRSIVVRVNDRGPFANGRIIDMSRRGAQLLGFDQKGTARVRVQYVENAPLEGSMVAQGDDEPSPPQVAAAPRGDIGVQTLAPPPPVKTAAVPKPAPPQLQPAAPPPVPQVRAVAVADLPQDYTAQTVRVEPVKQTTIYIQAGAFTVYDNANRQSAKIGRFGPTRVTQTVVNGTDFYRVRLGPIESVERADQLLNQMITGGETQAHIVVE